MLDNLKKSLGTDGKDRGKGRKIFAAVLFSLIIIVFVFMGFIPDQMGGGVGGPVAQVNDAPISVGDYRNMVRQMESRFGGAGSNPMLSNFIRTQALENLIDREILFQKGQREGLYISAPEIQNTIVNIPVFQRDGVFQHSLYNNVLKENRLNKTKFESRIAKDISGTKLRAVLGRALKVNSRESVLQKNINQKQMNIEFVKFSESDLSEEMRAKRIWSEKELSEVDSEVDKQIEAYYNNHKSEFTTKEQVQASHILIKFKEGDKKSEADALNKINKIYADVIKPENKEQFSTFAKEHTEDSGSKESGGDLGYFAKGKMVKPFEDKAFSMKVGKISKPVRSNYGFHIIKLIAKKAELIKEIAEVKPDIIKIVLAKNIIKGSISNLKESFKDDTYSEAITKFVKNNNLKWQETAPFSLSAGSVPKVGESEELIVAAFKLSAKEKFTKKIFLINGKSYLIKFKETVTSDVNLESSAEQKGVARVGDVFKQMNDYWKSTADVIRNTPGSSVQ